MQVAYLICQSGNRAGHHGAADNIWDCQGQDWARADSQLGAGTVVFDPFGGDPDETHHPEAAWSTLAAVSARARQLEE